MKKFTLIHKDTQQELGYLEIDVNGRAVFRLADAVNSSVWNAVGFLPVDPKKRVLEDQGIIYYSLYSRVPLKERMNKKESREETINYVHRNPLSVVTDSFSFVTC